MEIKLWQVRIRQNALVKGFGDKRTFGEYIALVHSELSEALEEYRNGNMDKGYEDSVYYGPDGKPEGVGIELADAAIRIMDMCENYGIDLEKCIRIKHGYNITRPYKHGGKVI